MTAIGFCNTVPTKSHHHMGSSHVVPFSYGHCATPSYSSWGNHCATPTVSSHHGFNHCATPSYNFCATPQVSWNQHCATPAVSHFGGHWGGASVTNCAPTFNTHWAGASHCAPTFSTVAAAAPVATWHGGHHNWGHGHHGFNWGHGHGHHHIAASHCHTPTVNHFPHWDFGASHLHWGGHHHGHAHAHAHVDTHAHGHVHVDNHATTHVTTHRTLCSDPNCKDDHGQPLPTVSNNNN